MIRARPGRLLLFLVLVLGARSGVAQTCGVYPDVALQPTPLNMDPGAEYAAWTRSWQGMPSIERMDNGRLWAAWTAGGVKAGPDNYVLLVTSMDDGHTWSRPMLVIDPPGNVAVLAPMLWRDPGDRLWLFWNQGYGAWWDGRGGVWGVAAGAADSTRPTWGRVGRVADGRLGGKPTVTRTGDWLLPVFVPHGGSKLGEENDYYHLGLTPCVVESLSHDLGQLKGANMYRSSDDGQTWQFLGQANLPDTSGAAADRDLSEHAVVERGDGSLWMLLSTPTGIGQSASADSGTTWSPVIDSGIPHSPGRFVARRLDSGRLLLIRNEPPGIRDSAGCQDCGEPDRPHLTAWLSEDDGASWLGGLLIDARETVSYPDVAQARDGRLFVIYDRKRDTDREIWMAVFTEDDVLSGTCASYDCQLRMPVSRP
jgi:hypothetical protein